MNQYRPCIVMHIVSLLNLSLQEDIVSAHWLSSVCFIAGQITCQLSHQASQLMTAVTHSACLAPGPRMCVHYSLQMYRYTPTN
jgi:hypothetical protein